MGRSSGCPHAAPADAQASQSQEEAVSRSPSGPEAGRVAGSAPRPPLGGGPPIAPVHTSRSSSADPGAHDTPEAWEWPAPLAEDQASRAVQWGEQAPPSRAGQHRGRCSASLNLGSLACDTEVVFPACRGGRRERMSLRSVRCLARDGGSAVGKTVLVLWVNSIRRGRLPPPPGFLLLVVGPSCNAALCGVSKTGPGAYSAPESERARGLVASLSRFCSRNQVRSWCSLGLSYRHGC